ENWSTFVTWSTRTCRRRIIDFVSLPVTTAGCERRGRIPGFRDSSGLVPDELVPGGVRGGVSSALVGGVSIAGAATGVSVQHASGGAGSRTHTGGSRSA